VLQSSGWVNLFFAHGGKMHIPKARFCFSLLLVLGLLMPAGGVIPAQAGAATVTQQWLKIARRLPVMLPMPNTGGPWRRVAMAPVL
jgi:hypothetical protein